MSRSVSASDPAALVERALGSTVDVLLVDDDPHSLDRLATRLDREERLAIATASAAAEALDRLREVDCVVSDYALGATTGLDLLAAIREREASLPFVLHAGEPPAGAVAELLADERTDYQRKDAAPAAVALLARRIRRLVDRGRAIDGLRRTAAGLEATRDGIALAGPDGTVAFTNGRYATTFGVSREAVVGAHWRDRYPDAEADRLAADAIPTATDGWRWTGTGVGRDGGGEPVALRLGIVGLDDGSLVFVVTPVDRDGTASGEARNGGTDRSA